MSGIDAFVDKLSCFISVVFGMNYFLAFGLEIPLFRDTVMPTLMTTFGAAATEEDLDLSSSMLSIFGGCWALTACFNCISGLTGNNESAEARSNRQFVSTASWIAWTLGFGLWTYKGGQGGYFGSLFSLQWNIVFAVMTIFHLKWMGGPEGFLQKIKGD